MKSITLVMIATLLSVMIGCTQAKPPLNPEVIVKATPESRANSESRPKPDNRPNPDDMMMCTMEVKLCPDGTGVGRTGPKCEFAPCPTTPPK